VKWVNVYYSFQYRLDRSKRLVGQQAGSRVVRRRAAVLRNANQCPRAFYFVTHSTSERLTRMTNSTNMRVLRATCHLCSLCAFSACSLLSVCCGGAVCHEGRPPSMLTMLEEERRARIVSDDRPLFCIRRLKCTPLKR
jgi:hypothetical protein